MSTSTNDHVPAIASRRLAQDERERRTIAILAEAVQGTDADRQSAYERAVELNLGLALSLAARYSGRGVPDEDLQQVACLALVKAVRRFDLGESDSFVAYAIPTIRGELRRYFRDMGWVVRPPRRIQELQASIRSIEPELRQQLRREPSVEELSRALDTPVDEVREAIDIATCFTPMSTDRPSSVDGVQSLGDRLVAEGGEFAAAEARLMLAPLLDTLDARERLIIDLRFSEELTQREIGERVGLSQMQVSRILAGIYARLRSELEATVDTAA